ncbi:hypothetical protein [Photobacterium kishitanii]|uniref:Uncharacterized protein n=1 Tax=Photobacterium kishitanii TaxID=318456 RepID=A0A2T3KMI3_9GAMM|nr:hypothetical protein [Photobacterium kishitanii]PSV01009.1 hypothetical protein C9J27_02995 [Photobacterium kishitanii]
MTNIKHIKGADGALMFCSIAIATITAFASMILTANFMSDLGSSIGLGVTFLVIGISLDLAKHLSPLLALHHSEQNKPLFAGVLYLFSLALMVVSIVASATSLQKGIETANKDYVSMSIETKKIDEQISILRSEKAGYEAQGKAQLLVHQVSKLPKTNAKIADVNKQLLVLIQQKNEAANNVTGNTKKDIFLIFKTQILYSLATIIELISLLMTVSAFRQYRLFSVTLFNNNELHGDALHESHEVHEVHEVHEAQHHKVHESPLRDKHENLSKEAHETIRANLSHEPITSRSDESPKHVAEPMTDVYTDNQKVPVHDSNLAVKQACAISRTSQKHNNLPKLLEDEIIEIEQPTDTKEFSKKNDTAEISRKPNASSFLTNRKTKAKLTLAFLKNEIKSGNVKPKYGDINDLFICSRENVKTALKELELEGVIRLKNSRTYELI